MEEDELARIDAMMANQSAELPESSGKDKKKRPAHSDAPPPWYKCHRCQQTGHFAQNCPLATDIDTALLKNVRQARGIPRAFLQAATEEDLKRLGTGGYVTATGELMIMKQATEEQKVRIVGESEEAALKRYFGGIDPYRIKSFFQCPIDDKLLREPTVTPCCGLTFCRNCLITQIERSFDQNFKHLCPGCKEPIQIDQLILDVKLSNLISYILYGELATFKSNIHADMEYQKETPNKKSKIEKQSKQKFEVDVNLGDVHELQEGNNEDLKGIIRVPAGTLNPYFINTRGETLSESDFNLWQAKYQEALKREKNKNKIS
jgi:Zinc knuckle